MAAAEHIRHLLEKYLHDTYTQQEYEELLTYFGIEGNEETARQLLYDVLTSGDIKQAISEERMATVINNAQERLQSRINKPSRSLTRRLIPYAAAVLIFFSVGIGIYWYTQNNTPQTQLTSRYGDDVLPGGNRAMLTFSDGSTIPLSGDKEGIINGENLTYDDGTPIEAVKTEYATLTTPKGGQYQITLPDGSKVWLNAASSLKYPTKFTGNERKVELTGEAYFEITHNPHQPFIVESNSQRIEVLGTQFNVAAYDNEPTIATTLVQGAVEVFHVASGYSVTMAPGEQAVLYGNTLNIEKVDIAEYTAWKDGYFHFKATDLKTILRQIERWYDVDVDYTTVPDRKLYARIDRSKKLSAVLYMFESTSEVKFKLEGRRLRIDK